MATGTGMFIVLPHTGLRRAEGMVTPRQSAGKAEAYLQDRLESRRGRREPAARRPDVFGQLGRCSRSVVMLKRSGGCRSSRLW